MKVDRFATIGQILERLDLLASRLASLEEAHNALDLQAQELMLRTQYSMQHIVVARPRRSGLVLGAGESPVEQATLYEFFIREREDFALRLAEAQHAIAENLQAAADAERDGRQLTIGEQEQQRDPVLDPSVLVATGPASHI